MKTFSINDVIFARVTMMGQELLNLRISGVTSMSALLQRIRHELGACIGMISLTVRNLSQGWCQTASYRVA